MAVPRTPLEIIGYAAHHLPMEDPTKPTIPEMLADMDASDAEIEAGQIVSGEAVRRLFDDALARIEAKKANTPRREASSRGRTGLG